MMKDFSGGVLARKKIVLIFLLSILLPSLIVGYLSLRTFSQRREAVKNLLESNLWISGESALKTIEDALLQHEKDALMPENFPALSELEKTERPPFHNSVYLKDTKDTAGKLFMLDSEYRIIFPRTGSEHSSTLPSEKNLRNREFFQAMERADVYEFSEKNYSRAAALYQRCALNAPSRPHRAIAMEGLGRCLFSSRKYDEAHKAYIELSDKYGHLPNKADHPYGIVAAFQLYEIESRRNREEAGLKILIELYEKIRNGAWLINLPAYDFFTAEIESILDEKSREVKFPYIQETYRALKNQEPSFLRALIFAEFLKREVVPKIKEKMAVSPSAAQAQPERLLVSRDKGYRLISYSFLPDVQTGSTRYIGFCWDLDSLQKKILPKVLGDISNETGLHLRIIEEGRGDIESSKEKPASRDSLILSYRQFPFPWKLLVTQPAWEDVERTARRENFLYGALLAFIVVLMILGAILLARDISRESETTRLKTEFVHNISHELKTPLTLIRLYGETLQRKENLTDKQRKESYEIITKESERLSHMINNVLDFSRIEMGRKEFSFHKGRLSDVVRDTLESYLYHLQKKGFSVQTDIAPDLPGMNFDGEAIASVLVNLLSNVMKFSPHEKEITVKLFKENENVVLQVADKGIGISPKEVNKIFRRFYRVKNEIVSETRGSGLGLTLVKHIAEAHGGHVHVESEPGRGSIFSIILPIPGPEKG